MFKFRRTILVFNALFLGLTGFAQMIFEAFSHFCGIGPLGKIFTDMPYTIGFFETHGLAVLVGAIMFHASLGKPERFWHLFSVGVQLLLGGANLMFWDSFIRLDFVIPGRVATVFHGIFIPVHTACYLQAEAQTYLYRK